VRADRGVDANSRMVSAFFSGGPGYAVETPPEMGPLEALAGQESTLRGGTLEVPVVDHPTWAGTARLGFSQRSASTKAKRIR
jgi:hypothetical protein